MKHFQLGPLYSRKLLQMIANNRSLPAQTELSIKGAEPSRCVIEWRGKGAGRIGSGIGIGQYGHRVLALFFWTGSGEGAAMLRLIWCKVNCIDFVINESFAFHQPVHGKKKWPGQENPIDSGLNWYGKVSIKIADFLFDWFNSLRWTDEIIAYSSENGVQIDMVDR